MLHGPREAEVQQPLAALQSIPSVIVEVNLAGELPDERGVQCQAMLPRLFLRRRKADRLGEALR
jgi:hypothetical protein